MRQLLGLRVSRTGSSFCKPSSHVVWSGLTEADREQHKAFILDKVACPKHDGETTFEPVESPVLVNAPGLYQTDKGHTVEITSVGAEGTANAIRATGHTFKRTPKGRVKPGLLVHVCINGEGYGCSAGLRLVAKTTVIKT